jgi:hypothetical protein
MKKGIWLLGLLASTAIGATPALAQQATTPAATADEVQALQQEVQALQARLDKLDSEQQATAAAVAATPAPAPVQAVAAPAPTGWFSNTTIGGKAYINVSGISQRSDGEHTSQDGVQADVKRFYLTVDHKFSNVFSADLTTDFRYGSNGLSNDTVVYVKKAYLQATLSKAFYVRVGAADLPWVPFVENVYGYRFVENTLIDRTKYGTSSDYGVHVGGSLAGGVINYAVSAIDGLGYKTRDRNSNTVDLEGRVSVNLIKSITLAVGGYTGKLGKSVDGDPGTVTDHRATRFDALAAYTGKRIHVGVEYFNAHDWNNITTTVEDDSQGYSAFGSFAFTPKVSLFGRFDWVDPNRDTDPAQVEHYFNVGMDYAADKNIDIALVYKRDKADNGLISTSNGTIGGAVDGTYDELGVFTQLKF